MNNNKFLNGSSIKYLAAITTAAILSACTGGESSSSSSTTSSEPTFTRSSSPELSSSLGPNSSSAPASSSEPASSEQASSSAPATTTATNLALNKTVKQASTGSGGVATRAVDGNTDGAYANASVTHTQPGGQPWWQVDLGSSEFISHINLFNRTDGCCSHRLSSFYVLVSDTDFTAEGVTASLKQDGVTGYYFESTVDGSISFDVELNARYIRVQLANGDFALSLAEVQVMSAGEAPNRPQNIVTAEIAEPPLTHINVGAIDMQAAQAAYNQHCAACHGEDGNGTVYPIPDIAACTHTDCTNVAVMAEYIARAMPPGANTANCVLSENDAHLSCAAMTSAYIANNFSTQNGSTDLDNPGNSTELSCEAETGVRRVKNLLTGQAPTAAEVFSAANEVSSVVTNANNLKDLVANWIETDEFDAKMLEFFKKTLQQTSIVQDDYSAQLDGHEINDRLRIHDPFITAMTESMARTALWLIENDRPLSEIASGRTWMMTTQMMAYLLKADSSGVDDGLSFYHNDTTLNGITFNANTPHAVQIENKMFYTPIVLAWQGNGFDCNSDPVLYDGIFHGRFFSAFMNPTGNPLICRNDIRPQIFNASDASDWRPVTMVRGEPAEWWNALALRGADTLTLRTSRTGFFSHPAFFATWRTNLDNDFRVTTNQALIAGLGRGFETTDTSIPLGDEGLSDDHADPTTLCWSCHNTLDPMRTYFDIDFEPSFYGSQPNQVPPNYQASFSFLGHSGSGGDLEDFGRFIGEHPLFATGWVQKLCGYANSSHCDESDPEFQRIVSVFKNTNLNFKTMMIELFSSPLVTSTSCGTDVEKEIIPISLARHDHLCPTLAARTGINNICNLASTSVMASALPADAWARGADEADQATDPGMFYRATVEALCNSVVIELVNKANSPLQTTDVTGSLDWVVEGFMGLSQADSRYAAIRQIVQNNYESMAGLGVTNIRRLRETSKLACISPFLSSTDF